MEKHFHANSNKIIIFFIGFVFISFTAFSQPVSNIKFRNFNAPAYFNFKSPANKQLNIIKDSISKIDSLGHKKLTSNESFIVKGLQLKKDSIERLYSTKSIRYLLKTIGDSIFYYNKLKITVFKQFALINLKKAADSVLSIKGKIDSFHLFKIQLKEAYKSTKYFTLFPAISTQSAKYFFGDGIISDSGKINNDTIDQKNFYTFQNWNVFYNQGSQNVLLHSEIFTNYFGPLRIELSTFFNLPKTDSTSKAKAGSANTTSLLAAGGGNLMLQLKFPILYIHSYNQLVKFQSLFNPKISADINDSSLFCTYTGVGIYNILSLTTLDNKLSFSAEASYSQTWGNSIFMNELGLDGSQRKSFNLWSFTFGFQLVKSFGIRYTWYSSQNSFINTKLSNNNVISFNTSF